jgi:hypothetical protein
MLLNHIRVVIPISEIKRPTIRQGKYYLITEADSNPPV